MIVCPNCETRHEESHKFCFECGAAISPDQVPLLSLRELDTLVRKKVDERMREEAGETAFKVVDYVAKFMKGSVLAFLFASVIFGYLGLRAINNLDEMERKVQDDLYQIETRMMSFENRADRLFQKLDKDIKKSNEDASRLKDVHGTISGQIEKAQEKSEKLVDETTNLREESADLYGKSADLYARHENQRFSILITYADRWDKVHAKINRIQRELMQKGFRVPFDNISPGHVESSGNDGDSRVPIRIFYHGEHIDIVEAARNVSRILAELADEEHLAVPEEPKLRRLEDRKFEIEIQLAATEDRETTGSETGSPAVG